MEKIKKSDHFYLIDGSGYIFRAYYALPPLTRKSDGLPVGAVSGFCNMLFKLLEDSKSNDNLEKPTHFAVIFDSARKNFRNEIYSEYKGNRSDAPDDLIPQFEYIRKSVKAFNLPSIELINYEADDLIATYVEKILDLGAKVTIVSSDKDLMQLYKKGVRIYDPMKNKFINKDDLLILNNTSVLPARLFGKKETGGEVEVFLERIIGETTALVQIRSSRSPKPGTLIIVEKNEHRHKLLCKERKEGFFIVDFQEDPKKIFNSLGNTPLPPYIKRKIEIEDRHRYQTVYENKDYQESVAAPTAGLHFDNLLLTNIEKIGAKIRYINLTVGAGTFQPVKAENIKDHKIHSEYISVSKELVTEIINTKKIGGNIIAVGTTSLRAIETVFSKKLDQFDGLTDIFIYPGYKFKAVDKLITNFHLPKSTLLMLVAAFIGFDRMKELYEIAIKKRYRFLSYGDAMFLTRK